MPPFWRLEHRGTGAGRGGAASSSDARFGARARLFRGVPKERKRLEERLVRGALKFAR